MHNHDNDRSIQSSTDRRAMLAGLGGLAAGALLSSGRSAHAGPLNPPLGAISSTPGPEPRTAINQINTPGDANNTFRITQPGSYYLTGNVQGESGKNGITITAANVTLDLMGYAVSGVPGSLRGILMPTFYSGVVIRNGFVSGWDQDGIRARIDGGAIERVHVHNNGGWGIDNDAGFVFRITDCSAYSNGSQVSDTGGIRSGTRTHIEACQARDNTGSGIDINDASVAKNIISTNNTGSGILMNDECTISGCTAAENNGNGIRGNNGCTISGCSTRQNRLDGILINFSNLVVGNICATNGFLIGDAAGIHALASDNRIEGNSCTDADRGIDVDTLGNFIVRNTCSGNTLNWDIAPNNKVGTIVNAPNSGSISGDTGGAGVGSTNPWTNFTF